MKKRITLMMLAMLMVLSLLAGCSKKSAKVDEIIGNWDAVTIEMGGVSVDMKQFAEMLGESEETTKITMVFTEDGKVSLDAAGEKGEGTWKANGGKYELIIDGETDEISIVEGQIIIEDDSDGELMKMVFEKQQ